MSGRSLALLCALLAVPSLAAAPTGPQTLLVLELRQLDEAARRPAQTLSTFLAQDIDRTQRFNVISQADVQTMIGVERQRQLLGCSDDASSCLAELGGALNAKYIVSGTVTRVGDKLRADVQLLDSQRGSVLVRATESAQDEAALSATSRVLALKLVHGVPEGVGATLNEGLPQGWWAGFAAGAAVLAAGSGGSYYLAHREAQRLRDGDPAIRDLGAVDATIARGKLYQDVSVGLLAGAVLSGAASAGLTLFGVPERKAPQVAILVIPNGAGLAWSFP